ncbi:hypothetical protein JZ751_017306 [Albula glossodonta]|uniref:Uncharacterized protein n=1 Tax=Albula glossodonta TaxID=121402 RepID=A0A8T2MKC4_9TELE|nr:hypothetical protein JZ751_017306 [Albula glossodonta]
MTSDPAFGVFHVRPRALVWAQGHHGYMMCWKVIEASTQFFGFVTFSFPIHPDVSRLGKLVSAIFGEDDGCIGGHLDVLQKLSLWVTSVHLVGIHSVHGDVHILRRVQRDGHSEHLYSCLRPPPVTTANLLPEQLCDITGPCSSSVTSLGPAPAL